MQHSPVQPSPLFTATQAVIDYPKLPGACKVLSSSLVCIGLSMRDAATTGAPSQVQVEPELGLLVDIVYTKDFSVKSQLFQGCRAVCFRTANVSITWSPGAGFRIGYLQDQEVGSWV